MWLRFINNRINKQISGMRLVVLLLGVLIISCKFNNNKKYPAKFTYKENRTVFIQPFSSIDSSYITYLRNHIGDFYKVEVKILNTASLPANAFYSLRKRYVADSLLQHLKTKSLNPDVYVLGLTSKDISTQNEGCVNWGVMGLGFMPGNACVISVFRLKKRINTRQQVYERLLKVAIHELGHNFGLAHCPNQFCIMVDAEGKNKLDGEKKLCKNCTNFLHNKGIL